MSNPPAAPRSRRERPAKPALTRDGIVAAAVRVMRAEGLQKVTMRRLAQELDTGPASLYVYVRNTDELHAAVLDHLLGGVDLGPARAEGDWRERLERILTACMDLLFAHPGLAQSALLARPSGRHYLDLVDALLGLLAEGGAPDAQAAWGVDLLLQFATATAAEHSGHDLAPESREEWADLTRAVRDADPATHPRIAALGGLLLGGEPQARVTWGLRMLVNGILHTPVPGPTGPGTDRPTP
ncbi:TetR/AcrR family transcriptional regulator [Kitasatospora sp. NBC_01539]|uniref:TetR/AcrR family transcriptional regulator n=1 Tax=Kitasatospora sp. NBC_01539 TaxID=2903577 RepID=UPI0038601E74